MRRGRCLCGAVRYELEGELPPRVNCHCRYCRRAHGAAFATVAFVPRASLRFDEGESEIREYEKEGGARGFCGRCGTRLYNRAASMPDFLSLVVPSLEEDPAEPPIMHINVESKAAWFEILDGRPQHPAFPPLPKSAAP